jgi:hypothetical protein
MVPAVNELRSVVPPLRLFESSGVALRQPTSLPGLRAPAIDDYREILPRRRPCRGTQSDGRSLAATVLAGFRGVMPRQERAHAR